MGELRGGSTVGGYKIVTKDDVRIKLRIENGKLQYSEDGSTWYDAEYSSDGTAVSGDILSGKTAYVDGIKVTGNIPSKGAQTYTPGASNQTISSGQYLSGTQTISGDADLISANIKSGKNIFGIAGSSVVVDTSAGDAVTSDILSGKKGYVDGSLITGSMTNRGAVVITPTTANQAIAAGYHNGSGYVVGDPDLIATNIKSGVSILGVTGTYSGEALTVAMGKKTYITSDGGSSFITVSGLSFTPQLAYTARSGNNDAGWVNGTYSNTFCYWQDGSSSSTLWQDTSTDSNGILVYSGGFKLKYAAVSNSAAALWVASAGY